MGDVKDTTDEFDPGTYDDDEGHTASDDGPLDVNPDLEEALYQETLSKLKEAGF